MALRTATPMGDWRSVKATCDVSAGWVGIKDAVLDDALGARVSYLYQINDGVAAILESADFGDEAVAIYHAEKIMVPKDTDSADVFTGVLNRVYWDPATRLCKAEYDSGYFWIGVNTEPADAADLYVEIDLKGDHAEVEVVLP